MIISSASRADSDTAMKAFKYGASDYVEKPALINLEERGDEIRTKLRSLSLVKNKKIDVSSFDKENQMSFKINQPEKKLRVLAGSFSDLSTVKNYFKDLDNSQPPSLFFIEGMGEILENVVKENQKDFKKNVVYFTGLETKLEPNTIYIGDLKKFLGEMLSKHKALPLSLNVFNSVSEAGQKIIRGKLSDYPKYELLLEDSGEKKYVEKYIKNN
jgi:chemotaxis protein methyltransferase CheR